MWSLCSGVVEAQYANCHSVSIPDKCFGRQPARRQEGELVATRSRSKHHVYRCKTISHTHWTALHVILKAKEHRYMAFVHGRAAVPCVIGVDDSTITLLSIIQSSRQILSQLTYCEDQAEFAELLHDACEPF